MKIQSIPVFPDPPEAVSAAAKRRQASKTLATMIAAAGLTLGMYFVQACSRSASPGPNGGDVVALNDGKTSAEVLANSDTGEVMVHTFDNALRSSRPVEARPMTMGTGQSQMELEPQPLDSDPSGYSSRFYGRADWMRGGNVRPGWISHAGTGTSAQQFEWNRCWQAGRGHGPMWAEMAGHGRGMHEGGPGGMHRE